MEPEERCNTQKASEVCKAPTEDWHKINCDSSFVKENVLAGVGVILRNENGILVDGICEVVLADSPLVAEALAVRRGISLALKRGTRKWS